MKLTDKMSYLRGMVDGMELDLTESKEGKVLKQVLDVMQELTDYVTDLQDQVNELTEVASLLDEDLGDVEDLLYGEEEDLSSVQTLDAPKYRYDAEEEASEDEDDLYEAVCPSCQQVIALDESVLSKSEMACPYCGEILEFDFSDLDFDADGSDDTANSTN